MEEKTGENTDNVAIQIFSKVGVKINKSNINRSHRLGPKKNHGREKKRPIIVSLISYEHKNAVFKVKKNLKG